MLHITDLQSPTLFRLKKTIKYRHTGRLGIKRETTGYK